MNVSEAVEMKVQAAPRPRWRPRFSLAWLIVAALFTSSLILLALSQSRLREITAENSEMRTKLGRLTINDRQSAYCIQVPSRNTEGCWEWNIFAPEGVHFRVHCAMEAIPSGGAFPAPMQHSGGCSELYVGPGQNNVRGSWGVDGQFYLSCNSQYQSFVAPKIGREMFGVLREGEILNDNERRPAHAVVTGSNGQESLNLSVSPQLLRVREMIRCGPSGGSFQPNPEPCEGLLIWLEPTLNKGQ